MHINNDIEEALEVQVVVAEHTLLLLFAYTTELAKQVNGSRFELIVQVMEA